MLARAGDELGHTRARARLTHASQSDRPKADVSQLFSIPSEPHRVLYSPIR